MQLSQQRIEVTHQTRTHGFRFSARDALVILCSAAITWWLRSMSFELWWIAPLVLGHFFLFCNVFLVWQRWEFVWAVIFIANVTIHFALGFSDWFPCLLWQTPVTITVIVLQMRSPWYHGIFAQRINPQLDEYLGSGR